MVHLSARTVAALDALARVIVPELDAADGDSWRRFHAVIDEALGDRPPRLRRQFAVFLGLVHVLAVARHGRPFARLAPEQQAALLMWLQDRAPSLLRKGFWGLKTLVFMGYYAQGEVAATLGYAPSFSGNERLHA